MPEVPHGLAHVVAETPLVQLGDDAGLISIPGLGRALVGAAGVEATFLEPEVEPGAARALGVPGAALAALLAGRFALRGAAVSVSGAGVVITSSSAGGASTAAAMLCAEGATLLGDAVVVVDGTPPMVHPTGNTIDLFPDAAHAVGRDPHEVSPVRAGNAKAAYPHDGAGCAVPLGLIVELGVENLLASEPRAEPLVGFEGVSALVRATWHAWAINPTGRSASHMAWALGLIGAAPTVRVELQRGRYDRSGLANLVRTELAMAR